MRRLAVELMTVSAPTHIARRVLRLLRAHLARVVGARRHGEPDELARGRLRRGDRRRRRAFAGKIEQPAVRHDARGPAQRELALLREVTVDFEPREAPRVRGYMARPALDRVFEISIALLQMVRAQEKALRPVNLGVPRHARPSRIPLPGASFAAQIRRDWRRGDTTEPRLHAPLLLQPIVRLGEQRHERLEKASVRAFRFGAPTLDVSVPQFRLAGYDDAAKPAVRLDRMVDPVRGQILKQCVQRALHRAVSEDLMGLEVREAALDRRPRVKILAAWRSEHDGQRLLDRTAEFERIVFQRADHRAT